MTKQEVMLFYESDAHEQEVARVLEQAKAVIESQKSLENCAIVFDIDETSLNHYKPFRDAGFPQDENHQIWGELISKTVATPVKVTLEFYKYCLSKGLKVFFISARLAKYLENTKKALISAGYTVFEDVLVFPENVGEYRTDYFKNFKAKKRAYIESQGYRVLVSIGDQASDLSGGFAKYAFQLPNYLYGENAVFKD